MYSSYSLSKRLVSIPILAIQLLLICTVSSLNLTNNYLNHKCLVSQGKYKPGSKYEDNLNRLFQDISTQPYFQDGFSHTTLRMAPHSVTMVTLTGLNAVPALLQPSARRCPRNKAGIIWYDQCFLDVNMIDDQIPRKTKYENIFSMHNPNSVIGDTYSFKKKTRDFLYELILKADKPTADGIDFLYYAAGEKNLGENKLYAMVQCVQDIFDCKGCLEWSIKEIFKSCDTKQGARVLGTNCNVRYELYPFLRI